MENYILNVITAIRKNSPIRFHCWQFFKIIKAVFPFAEACYDGDHVAVKISGGFYDIDGIVENTERYLPIEDYGENHIALLEDASQNYYEDQISKLKFGEINA